MKLAAFQGPDGVWTTCIVSRVRSDDTADLIAFCPRASDPLGRAYPLSSGETRGDWFSFTGVPRDEFMDMATGIRWRSELP